MSHCLNIKMPPTTMRAAQFRPDTKKVQINTIPIPTIEPTEILVKIRSASLCHSDLMLLDGSFIGSEEPVTLGHEGVGTIEEMGDKVKGFNLGDRVGFLPNKGCCFTCRGCQIHNLNCENLPPNRKSLLQGFTCDGFFAEYASVDYRCAIILPETMDMKSASVFFCAGVTAFNAIHSCELQPGEWVAVIGCGGLGQMGIQYAKAMGLNVIGIDINDHVLSAARIAGADIAFNSLTHPNYLSDLKSATGGLGASAAAVFAASNVAYASAPKALRAGGVLMVVGLPPKPIEISAVDMMLGLYRIKSETTGPPWKLPRAIEFTARHGIKANVDFFELGDINEMIDQMGKGETVRRMVVVF